MAILESLNKKELSTPPILSTFKGGGENVGVTDICVD